MYDDDEASEGSGNDLIEEALELYEKAIEHEDKNRKAFKDDIDFSPVLIGGAIDYFY